MPRRIIRPGLTTERDGFSPEAVDDLLVGLAATWAQEDPDFGAPALIARIRDDAARYEPLLGAAWVLRQSTDEHQRQRARKLLEASADADDVIVLGLRLPGFSSEALELATKRRKLDALLSLLVQPGASTVGRESLSYRVASLLQQRSWTMAETGEAGSWEYVFGDPSRRRVFALLDHATPEVRTAAAQTLSNLAWSEDFRAEVLRLLGARLGDPAVVRVACEVVERLRAHELLPKLRAIVDETPQRLAVFSALLACGDAGAVVAIYDRCTLEERHELVWPLVRTARGKRFLLERVGDETLPRELRARMYGALVSEGEGNALAHLAGLARG